jgi:hypothetical protein
VSVASAPRTVDQAPHKALPHRHARLACGRLAQPLHKPAQGNVCHEHGHPVSIGAQQDGLKQP